MSARNTEKAGARWADIVWATQVFAVDPVGVGGLWVRARRGGAVERWLDELRHVLVDAGVPLRPLPVSVEEGRLVGGIDLAATLATGRVVEDAGLLASADGGAVLLANADCVQQSTEVHLAAALDRGVINVERDGISRERPVRIGLIALEERAEGAGQMLCDRLALVLDFEGLLGAPAAMAKVEGWCGAARDRLAAVRVPDTVVEAVCGASLALGIRSERAAVLALKVGQISAALAGRDEVSEEDCTFAMRVVLAPRARTLPVPPEDEDSDPSELPPEPPQVQDGAETEDLQIDGRELQDMLIAAALAALPANVLATLRNGALRGAARSVGRAGTAQKSRQTGRRLASRRGDPRRGGVLDIIETLRAAAPLQGIRRRERGIVGTGVRGIEVRAADFRLRVFKNKRETTTVFVVDASGSAAIARLAEAKGAIELLLADCYSRRDKVALIAFRGTCAELLLEPTRSLTRVKRRLAALPGGGGTPLFSGIALAGVLAEHVSRKGGSASLVFLTDGKANIDRNGQASRQSAHADALNAARGVKASGVAAVVIDTSPRPGEQSREVATAMGARYLLLPYAGAAALSQAVRANLAQKTRDR